MVTVLVNNAPVTGINNLFSSSKTTTTTTNGSHLFKNKPLLQKDFLFKNNNHTVEESDTETEAEDYTYYNNSKTVEFNEFDFIVQTYSSDAYDRTKMAREPHLDLMEISAEVLDFKRNEMVVHPKSLKYMNLHDQEKQLDLLISTTASSGKPLTNTDLARINRLRSK
eukprot:Pgem_evm1s18866